MTTFIRVYVPGPFWEPLDYLLPKTFSFPAIGARVLVPLRSKEVVGIVIGSGTETHIPTHKLKWIAQVLDTAPLFEGAYLKLLQWLAEYYHAPLGDVFYMALPAVLRKGKPIVLSDVKADPIQKNKVTHLKLNTEQDQAVRRILSAQNTFQTFLLNGVTGSGKTEVYLRVIEEVIKQEQQALVLVPEIGLTPQTLKRFSERFGKSVFALHSGLSEKKRLLSWTAAKAGEAKVVIGTRSAILAPFKNLGVIIVDEEHDLSFKQQESIRYSARDTAVARANLINIPIVLGSATPSFESWMNAEKGKYQRIDLPMRIGDGGMPSWHLIDMRRKNVEAGFTQELLTAIEEHICAGQQVLLFLNRRGYAPAWMCHECGWSPECPHCDTKLTYHAKPPKLMCHICGYVQKIYYSCKQCQHKMTPLGIGTQRLEEALIEHFPQVPIVRIDRDSTSRKNSFEKMIAQIHAGHAQILLGTQMIAKGHHFPKVTMVGVLNADSGLYSADFRAPEHLAQLILQVAGRAGREHQPGKVYIQTYWPEHPIWQDLVKPEGYSRFVTDMLKRREIALLPPYRYMALCYAEAKSAEITEHFLKQEAQHAKALNIPQVNILGPISALQAKRAGYYRAQLLFMSEHRPALQQLLKRWVPQIREDPESHKVRWHIDVDPLEVL